MGVGKAESGPSGVTQAAALKKPSSFRLPLTSPPSWKIHAVADVIRRKNAMKRREMTSSTTATANPAAAQPKLTKGIADSSAPTDTPGLVSQPPQNQEQYEQRVLLTEQCLKELEMYTVNGAALQKRINSLHSLKANLHWLMLRSKAHERCLINDYPPAQRLIDVPTSTYFALPVLSPQAVMAQNAYTQTQNPPKADAVPNVSTTKSSTSSRGGKRSVVPSGVSTTNS